MKGAEARARADEVSFRLRAHLEPNEMLRGPLEPFDEPHWEWHFKIDTPLPWVSVLAWDDRDAGYLLRPIHDWRTQVVTTPNIDTAVRVLSHQLDVARRMWHEHAYQPT